MDTSLYLAIAEPNRRWILDRLVETPCSVNELVRQSSMSQPAVSKHLRVLREAGLVEARPQGQKRVYHLNTKPMQALDAWLTPYRQIWSKRFDDLEHHLAEQEN